MPTARVDWLAGVTQRDYTNHYDFLAGHRDDILDKIYSLYGTHIHEAFPDADCM
jgi:hypothetical protein